VLSNQVVKQLYLLIFKNLNPFLWQFFFEFEIATDLPQKLCGFLKILMVQV
jgi:hypothetical protein